MALGDHALTLRVTDRQAVGNYIWVARLPQREGEPRIAVAVGEQQDRLNALRCELWPGQVLRRSRARWLVNATRVAAAEFGG